MKKTGRLSGHYIQCSRTRQPSKSKFTHYTKPTSLANSLHFSCSHMFPLCDIQNLNICLIPSHCILRYNYVFYHTQTTVNDLVWTTLADSPLFFGQNYLISSFSPVRGAIAVYTVITVVDQRIAMLLRVSSQSSAWSVSCADHWDRHLATANLFQL